MMETAQTAQTHSVDSSQQAAAQTTPQHLLSRGRKRIAFVGAQLDARVMPRSDGNRIAMQAVRLHDRKLELLDPARSSATLGATLLETVDRIAAGRRFDIFCNNDLAGSDRAPPPLTIIRTRRS
jgi:LacI family gluconate utilization system Gnt-I transcriptional repressor